MPRRPLASRRAALVTGLGAAAGLGLAASGCSFDSLDPTTDDPTLTPSDGATPTTQTTTGDGDPDVALLDAAALAVSQAHQVVRTNLRRHPDQRAVLGPIERLHRAHARELGGLQPVTGGRAEPARRVLARVSRVEGSLQRTLTVQATEAESGALALLLASMAAAVAQGLATLPAAGS